MRRTVLCNEELGFTTAENHVNEKDKLQRKISSKMLTLMAAAVGQISWDRQSPFFEFNIP